MIRRTFDEMTRSHRWMLTCWMLTCGMLTWGTLATIGELGRACGQSPPPAAGGGTAGDAGEPEAKKPAPETDPLVLAVLELKPTTAAQYLRDAATLLDLQRPALAKDYLSRLLALRPGTAELVQLQQDFGSSLFLKFARREELQPEGGQLADAVMKAAEQTNQQSQRIAKLIKQLSGDDPVTQRVALAGLVSSGTAAVPELVGALAQNPPHARRLELALRSIGRAAVDPLTTSLAAKNDGLRVRVIQILGEIGDPQAAMALLSHACCPAAADSKSAASTPRTAARRALEQLVGEVPSPAQAVAALRTRFDERLEGIGPWSIDSSGKVLAWTWDADAQRPGRQRLPIDDTAMLAAAEIAVQMHHILPQNVELEQWHRVTALEVAQRSVGFEQPLEGLPLANTELPAKADLPYFERLLKLAGDHHLVGASLAILQQIEQLAPDQPSAELVAGHAGEPSVVAAALKSNHRRVRAAAARCILHWDPPTAYPGSSWLIDVLGQLASSGGRRSVAVGDPRTRDSQSMAGNFQSLGFQTELADRGRDLALKARANPDISLILISDMIDHPRYGELLQLLRNDERTARIPIGIMVHAAHEQRARQIAELDPLTIALVRPRRKQDITVATRRLLELGGRRPLGPAERAEQTRSAIEGLIQIAQRHDQRPFYDVGRCESALCVALQVSPFADRMAQLLGVLGSPRAQLALIDFASTASRPIEQRRAAAAAFRAAVDGHGVLLRKQRLLEQYDRYNDSATADRATQQLLGSLLDAIEAPLRKRRTADK